MRTTEHGIEGSRDVENVHHMRLMTLLQELVRERGYRGAARVLELDRRTVTTCATTGRLSRRARHALERALQEGAGSAAAQQRERNDGLEERVGSLEKGHGALEKGQDELGKELRKRMAAVEGRIKAVPRDDAQGTGAGHAGAGPSPERSGQSESGASDRGRRPASRPRMKREYPDLVTREPAEDDEDVFGDAWPLIVEWRELKDAHSTRGRGLEWLTEKERLLTVELTLLEEHDMTLPPERQPLRGLDRSGQTNWRRTALFDTRRARRKAELLRKVRRVLTFGLW